MPIEYPDPLIVLVVSLIAGGVIRVLLRVRKSRDKMVFAVSHVRQHRDFAEFERERSELKRDYPDLFAELESAFFDVDPVGISFEDNADEYEPEVGTVLPRLSGAGSARDVERILREEFDRWFEGNYDARRLKVLADRTWMIWASTPGARPSDIAAR